MRSHALKGLRGQSFLPLPVPRGCKHPRLWPPLPMNTCMPTFPQRLFWTLGLCLSSPPSRTTLTLKTKGNTTAKSLSPTGHTHKHIARTWWPLEASSQLVAPSTASGPRAQRQEPPHNRGQQGLPAFPSLVCVSGGVGVMSP